MSGGAYNYVYSRISDAAREVERRHHDQPHVVAFARLLAQCADVMRDIEWADSCDTAWDDKLDAKIRAVVTPAHELHIALTEAARALEFAFRDPSDPWGYTEAEHVTERLRAAIRRAEGDDA